MVELYPTSEKFEFGIFFFFFLVKLLDYFQLGKLNISCLLRIFQRDFLVSFYASLCESAALPLGVG